MHCRYVTNTHKSDVDVVTVSESVSQSVTPVTGRGAHQAKNVGGEQFKTVRKKIHFNVEIFLFSPDDRWDRLQPPRDPADGLTV